MRERERERERESAVRNRVENKTYPPPRGYVITYPHRSRRGVLTWRLSRASGGGREGGREGFDSCRHIQGENIQFSYFFGLVTMSGTCISENTSQNCVFAIELLLCVYGARHVRSTSGSN